MVVQLLQPAWLWGLLGLMIPIAIHLLHKRSQKVIMVGSLQPFRGGAPVQARRLRPNELWLLLLRCLLLSLFVLLLTEPVIFEEEQAQVHTVFIAPELATAFNADSLKEAGYSPRLLQPGTPVLGTTDPDDTDVLNYWDVFQEIERDNKTGDTVWLLMHPRMSYFSGKRPVLEKTYQTLAVPAINEQPALLEAVLQEQNQILLRWWEEQEGIWRIKEQLMPLADSAAMRKRFGQTAKIVAPDTLKIVLQYAERYKEEANRWQYALQLIDSVLPATILQITKLAAANSVSKSDLWVWLSDSVPSPGFQTPSGLLRAQLSVGKTEEWFIADLRDPGRYYLQSTLEQARNDRQQMANFIPALMDILPLPAASSPPAALLAEEQWKPIKGDVPLLAKEEAGQSLEQWLYALLLIAFLIERWISLRK